MLTIIIPVAIIITHTVSLNDDGWLRIISGCAIPTSSLKVYVALSNVTVITIRAKDSTY